MRFQSPQMPAWELVQPYFAESVAAGWYSNNGPCVQQLERRCSEFLGLRPAGVTVNNATTGLLVALRAALGEPRADRPFVALPSFTFIATAAAVRWAGWTPLFVDVDEDDWQVSASGLAELHRHRSQLAGVLPCSTFGTGLGADRRAQVRGLLTDLDVPVVYDSAAGFGAHDEDGLLLGGHGVAEVFSFHATKPFAIGEGGLITSHDEEVLSRARSLANFGFDETRALPGPIGINGKLSELQAAVGLAVLDGFADVLTRRRAVSQAILEELRHMGVRHQRSVDGSTFQFVATRMPSTSARDAVIAAATRAGIEVRVYYAPALHSVAAFAECPRVGDLPVTTGLVDEMLCLPMANDFGEDDAARLCELVRSALA